MIASLSYVDFVAIVDDSTIPAIQKIKPHIYVKGSDYKDKKDLTKKFTLKKKR